MRARAHTPVQPTAAPPSSPKRRGSPAGDLIALQRAIGNRALGRRLARKPAAWSGAVYLPGTEHLGHAYTLEGTSIVEKVGKKKRTVGAVAADGAYTLVDDTGTAIPGATGRVQDLIGKAASKGGPDPAISTATGGAGEFHLADDAGADHLYKVKDGGVFAVDGKKQELVGHVDAGGAYELLLAGAVRKGSLLDLAPGKVKGSFKRTEGKNVVQQLQIGQDPIPEGMLVLPDGTYRVKNGQLFRAGVKAAVGDVVVVRSGAGAKTADLALKLPCHYVDAAGKAVDLDLASKPPGAGSTLRIGKGRGWMVSTGTAWVDMQAKHAKKGFEMFGGGRVKAKLKALVAAKKISLTDDEINLMQATAEVESSGYLQCINTWDSDVVSFGFIQYTMAGSLQELIDLAPAAFARYGIKLGATTTLKRAKLGNVSVRGIQGASDLAELRGIEWATKFFLAGLDDEIIVAEATKAKGDIADTQKKLLAGASSSAHFSAARVVAILLELNNNRPAYVSKVVKRTGERTKSNPKITLDEFIDVLQEEMEDEYVTNRVKHGNGATDADARQKARNIVTKTARAFED